ncbi:MAG: hypothetical protein RL536_308 [Candidatus Parcubacteria bacterium]|jgi:DNA anti-recombination protein RmuC
MLRLRIIKSNYDINNMTKTTEITLNDLALKIDNLNSNLTSRMDNVNNALSIKIEGVNNTLSTRMDRMNVEMNKGFTRIENKIDDSVEELAGMMARELDNFGKTVVKNHETRISRTERKLQMA